MSAKKKTASKPTPIGWRIFFAILALGMTYLVVGNVLAGSVGERAEVDDIDLSYYKQSLNGDRNDHEWSLNYTFYADGEKYSGFTIWSGNRYSPHSGTGRYHVNYFAPYPQINRFSKYESLKNADDADDIIYGGGLLLIETLIGIAVIFIFLLIAGIPLPFFRSKKNKSRNIPAPQAADTPYSATVDAADAPKSKINAFTSKPNTNMTQTNINSAPAGVGYSNRLYSPEFQQAVAKRKKQRRTWSIIAIVAIIVVVPIVSYISEDTPLTTGFTLSIAIAAIVGAIIWVYSLFHRQGKPWEGTVEKKYTEDVISTKTTSDDKSQREERYRVRVRRDDGKKHIIDEERFRNTAYKYFEVGDRLRYLPNMTLAFPYEKYDKSGDDKIICVFCGKKNDIHDTHCKACRLPLLN